MMKPWDAGYVLLVEPQSVSEALRECIAEIESLRRDAERYRWLRKHGNQFYNCTTYQGVDDVLDAAIDAAMRGEKG